MDKTEATIFRTAPCRLLEYVAMTPFLVVLAPLILAVFSLQMERLERSVLHREEDRDHTDPDPESRKG